MDGSRPGDCGLCFLPLGPVIQFDTIGGAYINSATKAAQWAQWAKSDHVGRNCFVGDGVLLPCLFTIINNLIAAFFCFLLLAVVGNLFKFRLAFSKTVAGMKSAPGDRRYSGRV